ncbi:hypothetical protein KY386_03610 [Candidatus Parcubacteria bacterium]|nr:hypothetical protein [Candidatus Parcubacteria bacterium]
MQCPQCHSQTVKSSVGWLCLECGALAAGADAAAPPETAAKAAAAPPQPDKPQTAAADKPVPATAPAAALSAAQPAAHAGPVVPLKPHRRRWLVLGLAAAVLVLGAGALYVAAAQKPFQDYQHKLSAAQNASFSGRLQFSGDSFLSAMNSDMEFEGSYDRSVASKPKGELGFKGTWGKQNYDGQARLDDGSLYFKLGGPLLPVIRYRQSNLLYPLSADWHKTKLDQSLFDNYCQPGPSAKPAGLSLYRLSRQVKTQNSPWVNLWESLEGRRVAHYRGTVDSGSVPELIDGLNRELPAGCGLAFTGADFKSLKISYDLWTSPDWDRLRVQGEDDALGARFTLTLDSQGYGQAKVAAPPPAVDLNQLGHHHLELLARDTARRGHIDQLKAALAAYRQANRSRYPANLSALVPKHLPQIPVDPKTKQPYAYAPDRTRRAYTLSARLEEPNAGVYSVKGP